MAAHILKGFTREQKTLEADIAVAAMQYQRIDEGINNQVVLPRCRAQEIAAIIQMNFNARVLVRLIGMVLFSETIYGRIDLDGVDMLGSPLERAADVVTRSCSDYQDIGKRRSARVSIQQVGQRISRKRLVTRNHLLVIDQIYRQREVCVLKINSVIRRPGLLRLR